MPEREYNLRATFSARDKTGRTFKSIEGKIDKLEKKMSNLSGETAIVRVEDAGTIDDTDKRLQKLQRDHERLDGKKAELQASLRDKEARRSIDQLRKEAERGADMRLGVDTSDFRRAQPELKSFRNNISKMFAKSQKLEFESNDSEVRKEAADLKAYLGATLKDVDFDIDYVNAHETNRKIDATAQKQKQLEKDREFRVRQRGIDELNRKMENATKVRDELTEEPSVVEFDGDIKKFEKSLSQVTRRLDKEIEKTRNVKINARLVGEDDIASDAAKIQAQLQAIRDTKTIEINTKGVPEGIAKLATLQSYARKVEGRYVVDIDTSKLGMARAALQGASQGVQRFTNFLETARPLMVSFAQKVYVGQQAMFLFMKVVQLTAIGALGPLVGALTIAAASLVTFAGGLGLVAIAAMPVMKALSESKQNSEDLKAAQNSLKQSSEQLSQAQRGLGDAQENAARVAKQGQEQIASAVQAHKDSLQGITDAQRGVGQAEDTLARTRQDNARQIQDAIKAHKDAIGGIKDAQREVGAAERNLHSTRMDNARRVQDAIKAHKEALQGVQDARRGVEDARRDAQLEQEQVQRDINAAIKSEQDAIEGVKDARYDLGEAIDREDQAYQNLHDSQDDYNQALKDEKYNLQDLRYEMQGMYLDRRGLALDLKAAEEELREAEDPDERERAQLRIDRLKLREKQLTNDIREGQQGINEAQREGTDNLKSARQEMYDARQEQIDASKGVKEAQEGVADAEERATEAARNTNRVREEGARRMQAANRSIAEAQRGVAEAQAKAAEAENNIATVRRENAERERDAIEQVRKAERGVVEAREQAREAEANIARTREDAARREQDAMRAVMDAHRQLRDARQQEKEAEANIAKARQSAAQANQDAAQRIADAQRRVAQAQRDVQKEQNKINEILARTPSYMAPTIAAFNRFKDAASTAFRPASMLIARITEDAFDFGTRILPMLGTASLLSAQQMQAAFSNVNSIGQQNRAAQSLREILAFMPGITGAWTEAIGLFGVGFANVMAVAMPYALRFSRYIRDAAQAFVEWSGSEEGRRKLKEWFDAAVVVASALWDMIVGVGGAIVSWSIRHPQEVAWAIGLIKSVLLLVGTIIVWVVEKLRQFQNAPQWVQTATFAVLGLYYGLRLVGPLLLTIYRVAKWMWPAIAWLVKGAALGILGILRNLVVVGVMAFYRFAMAIPRAIGPAFRFIAIGASKAFTLVTAGLAILYTAFLEWKNFTIPVIGQLFKMWRGGTITTTEFIISAIRTLVATSFSIMAKGAVRALRWILSIAELLPGQMGNKVKGALDTAQGWAEQGINKLRNTIAGGTARTAMDMIKNANKGADGQQKAMERANRNSQKETLNMQKGMNKNTERAKNLGVADFNQLQRNTSKSNNKLLQDVLADFGKAERGIKRSTNQGKIKGSQNINQLGFNIGRSNNRMKNQTLNDFNAAQEGIFRNTKKGRERGSFQYEQFKKTAGIHTGNLRDTSGNHTDEAQRRIGANTLMARKKGVAALVELQEKGAVAMRGAQTRWVASSYEAADGMINAMNSILTGMREFIDKAGLDIKIKGGKIGPPTSGGSSMETEIASSRRNDRGDYNPKTGNIERYAAGGFNQQSSSGGVAHGDRPHAVYGEVPGVKEYFITSNPEYRQDQPRYLAGAADMLGYDVVPRPQKGSAGPSYYAMGGVGGTMDREVSSKFGVRGSSYPGHGASVDFNVVPWGQKATGNAYDVGSSIANHLVSNASRYGLGNAVWYNSINAGSGWRAPHRTSGDNTIRHFDHPHAGYDGGNLASSGNRDMFNGMRDAKLAGPPSGGGGTGPDYMGMFNDSVPKVDKLTSDWGSSIIEKANKAFLEKSRKALEDRVPDSSGGTAFGDFSGTQKDVAKTFAQNARSRGIPGELPVMTAIVESGLRNLSYGDRDSVGYFQQRASWGSRSQRMDPAYALDAFLDVAATHKGQYPYSASGLGAWAQDVQVSAFPGRYAKEFGTAQSLIGEKLTGYSNGGITNGAQLSMLGESGNEAVIPLNDPKAVSMLSRAFQKTAKAEDIHNRVDKRVQDSGEGAREVRDELEKLGDKIVDTLKDELQEIGLDQKTVDKLVGLGYNSAVELMKSRLGGDLVEDAIGERAGLYREMSDE